MPGFDGKGPAGKGSMTGGGFGPCNTTGVVYGRGRGGVPYGCGRGRGGRGMGKGTGLGAGNIQPQNTDEAVDDLKKQKNIIEQRIKDLENSKK